MFEYTPNLVVERDVEINVPIPGKGFKKAEVRVTFLILEGEEADKLAAENENGVAFWRRVVQGWDGFVTPEKASIPCTPETIAQMVGVPYVRKAFVRHYFATSYGNELRGN